MTVFRKNLASSLLGVIVVQVINIITTPLLARFLGPASFGEYSLLTSTFNTLLPLAALGVPMAVVVSKDWHREFLGRICLIIGSVLSVLSIILLIIYSAFFQFHLWMLLIPLFIITSALLQFSEYDLSRAGSFRFKSKTSVISSMSSNFIKIISSYIYSDVFLIAAAHVSAMILNARLNLVFSGSFKTKKRVSLRRFLAITRHYTDFIFFRSPQIAVNAFSQSIPLYFLSYHGSIAVAGSYALLRSILAMPSSFIGKAFVDVYYPKLKEDKDSGKPIQNTLIRSTFSLLAFAVLTFPLIYMTMPMLIKFITNENWTGLNQILPWMTLWMFAGFINRASVSAIPILGLEKQFFYFEIFTLILRFSCLPFGLLIGDSTFSISLYCMSGFIFNSSLICYCILRAK